MIKYRNLLFGLFLIPVAIYYLFFINKGIVMYDEGYYLHLSERILNGEIPYTDFYSTHTPGFFYILAILFKIFGTYIMVGRILTMSICLIIIFLTLVILKKFSIPSIKLTIFSLLIMISFGYPLINIPVVVWINVVLYQLLSITLISWFEAKAEFYFEYKYLLVIGILLAVSLFLKQNLGIAAIFTINFFIFFSKNKQLLNKVKSLIFVNFIWMAPSSIWIYFLLIKPSLNQMQDFIIFNQQLLFAYPFSYPPVSYILQPLGFFKLLPYYLPILLLIITFYNLLKKKKDWKIIYFFSLSLVGFFITILPTSDLIHVYPFLGMILVSFLVFTQRKKTRFNALIILFIILTTASGFYLTFFKGYYRYELPYSLQTTSIPLERAKGIFVDKQLSQDITYLSKFIYKNTSKEDYVFVYPFSPIFYFILDRKNPSKSSAFLPIHIGKDQQINAIKEIEARNTKYIITSNAYKFNTELSNYIQNQKEVFAAGRFKVFSRNIK